MRRVGSHPTRPHISITLYNTKRGSILWHEIGPRLQLKKDRRIGHECQGSAASILLLSAGVAAPGSPAETSCSSSRQRMRRRRQGPRRRPREPAQGGADGAAEQPAQGEEAAHGGRGDGCWKTTAPPAKSAVGTLPWTDCFSLDLRLRTREPPSPLRRSPR